MLICLVLTILPSLSKKAQLDAKSDTKSLCEHVEA